MSLDINDFTDSLFDNSFDDVFVTDGDDGVAVELLDPSVRTTEITETFTPIVEAVATPTPTVVPTKPQSGMDRARKIYADMNLANPNVRRCDVIKAMVNAKCSTDKGCGTYYNLIAAKDPNKPKRSKAG